MGVPVGVVVLATMGFSTYRTRRRMRAQQYEDQPYDEKQYGAFQKREFNKTLRKLKPGKGCWNSKEAEWIAKPMLMTLKAGYTTVVQVVI